MASIVRAYQFNSESGGFDGISGSVDTSGADLMVIVVLTQGTVASPDMQWNGTPLSPDYTNNTVPTMRVYHVYAPTGTHLVQWDPGLNWSEMFVVLFSSGHQSNFLPVTPDRVSAANAQTTTSLTSSTLSPAASSFVLSVYGIVNGQSEPPTGTVPTVGTALTMTTGNNPDNLFNSSSRLSAGISYRTGVTSTTMGWSWAGDTGQSNNECALLTFEVAAADAGPVTITPGAGSDVLAGRVPSLSIDMANDARVVIRKA